MPNTPPGPPGHDNPAERLREFERARGIAPDEAVPAESPPLAESEDEDEDEDEPEEATEDATGDATETRTERTAGAEAPTTPPAGEPEGATPDADEMPESETEGNNDA